MDDVLSLPARLWRSITGDSVPQPLPSPNSDVDAHDESLNEKHRRICLQWKRYRREYDFLLEHVKTQESTLKGIESELQEADRELTMAQTDLKVSTETVAELTKNCETSGIQEIVNVIGRLSSQLINLDRVIEKRRKHLAESHFQHNTLTAHVSRHSAMLIRRDSFKSISMDADFSDNSLDTQTKSELDDLQRQIAVVEIEMRQHKNVLEALQKQADSIRLERENLEVTKHRLESERRVALGSLTLAVGKAKQRKEALTESQKKLDELMLFQLNSLISFDKSRESLTIAESMMRQLRNEEHHLFSTKELPKLSPVVFRRHSSPELKNSTTTVSISVTLLGAQESLNRCGSLCATSRLLLFECQDDRPGCTQVAIRVSNIEELRICNGSVLVVLFKQNGSHSSIRFHGDPCDIDSVKELLHPRLQELREIEIVPVIPPISPQIMIHGESSILASELLQNLMFALPARNHFDQWRKLYSLTEHGMSLTTLYRAVGCSRVAILITMDEQGSVFGAFVSETLKVHSGYFGTGECFVFQLIEKNSHSSDPISCKTKGQLSVYSWSGKNKFFVLCRHDSISIGGGTHFAIFLKHSLREGSSGASDTFDSPILSSSRDFRVALFEVWGVVGESPISALISEH